MRTGERIIISEPRPRRACAEGAVTNRDSSTLQPSEPRPSGSATPDASGGAAQSALTVEILGRGAFGERTVRLRPNGDLFDVLERVGHVPLPPYIRRPDTFRRSRPLSDRVRARARFRGCAHRRPALHPGNSRAVPRRRGEHRARDAARRARNVSAAARRDDRASQAALRIVQRSPRNRSRDGRRFARGRRGDHQRPGDREPGARRSNRSETDLFIYPGFEFRRTGAMLTNFHLPKSSLLVLVCAFAGTGIDARRLPPCGGSAVPFLFLRRLHADPLRPAAASNHTGKLRWRTDKSWTTHGRITDESWTNRGQIVDKMPVDAVVLPANSRPMYSIRVALYNHSGGFQPASRGVKPR